MNSRILLIRSSAFQTSRLAKTASALLDAGHEVHVLSWKRGMEGDPPLREQLEGQGFPIDDVWVGEAPYARGVWGIPKRLEYIWAVMKYVRDHNFDAVHAIDLDSALPVALCRKVGWHDGYFAFDVADYIELYYTIPDFISRAISVVNRWVLTEADLIVLPDENRRTSVPKRGWSKISIVTNAPDIDQGVLDQLSGVPSRSDKLDVFYYGSLAEDRGIDLMLAAAQRVPEVNMWFAGWGNLAEQVERASAQQNNVGFFGTLSHREVMRRVAEMDLISIMYDPAYGVNQMASPNKLFEAMALGKPVVVAENTSIDELVEQKQIGWAIDYCAGKLINLLRSLDQAELNQRGHRAAQVYDEYRWKRSEQRLQRAYQQLFDTESA